PRFRLAALPHGLDPFDLPALGLRVDLLQLNGSGLVCLIAVDADDDLIAAIDRLLSLIRGVLNLPLNPAGFDGCERAAQGVDLCDERARVGLDLVGPFFDGPGAAQ